MKNDLRVLTNKQVELMEALVASGEQKTKHLMSTYLKSKYSSVVETKEYIYAEGDIPIALVSHMDTVFDAKRHYEPTVYYDRIKNVMCCPDGAGFDDKAGIFAIIQILRRGLRPHIILTTDEESGGAGASAISKIPCPFKDLRYIIQLDRRGAVDCVFYSCDNQNFINYVEGFGFAEAIGSFSDISIICPAWKIAGVNLSIGYYDEHSVSEILNVGHMLSTIEKVVVMLTEKDIPAFEYIPCKYDNYNWYRWVKPSKIISSEDHCGKCQKKFTKDEMVLVRKPNGIYENRCIDCLDGVDWCTACGEAYIPDPHDNAYHMCEDCIDEFFSGRY